MVQIFSDENNSCKIDFSKAIWATDQLNRIFHAAKASVLKDVDFVAETEDTLFFVEYKNANLSNATHPQAFKPLEDKKLNSVARKYYDSLNFLRAMQRGKKKQKVYVYILEAPHGDVVLRNRVKVLLKGRLPFLLQKQNDMSEKMIDCVTVISIDEWNDRYRDFPLQRL